MGLFHEDTRVDIECQKLRLRPWLVGIQNGAGGKGGVLKTRDIPSIERVREYQPGGLSLGEMAEGKGKQNLAY